MNKLGFTFTRNFIVLTLISLINWFSFGMLLPILPLYIRDFGVSMTIIGLVSTFRMFGFLIFEPAFGWLSDKVGRKKILISMSIFYAFLILVFTLVSEVWHFYPLSFLLTAAMSGLTVTAPASLTDTFSTSKRGKGYGIFLAIISLGQLFGPLLGGYLAEKTNYYIPFYISSLVAFIVPFIALQLIESENTSVFGKESNVTETSRHISFKKIITISFIAIFIAHALIIFNMEAVNSLLPIYAKESVKFSATASQVGIMVALASAASIPIQLSFGTLSDKIGRIPIIIINLILCGLFFFCFFIIEGIIQLYLLRAILAATWSAVWLCLMVLLIDLVPKGSYGTAIGVYYVGGDLGGMLGPLIVGYIYDIRGFDTSVYIMSASLFLAALIIIIAFRKANLFQFFKGKK